MTKNFSWCVRVYYEDTDAGGVVFYANYLKFFERARSEWLRAAGVQQQALMHSDGVMFVVTGTAVDYHAPAQLDDELNLTVAVEKLGRASVQFFQQAWRGQQLLTSGRIKVACVGAKSFRPQPIPASVLLKIAPPAEQ
ncbi:tol-pal system-associated acyl-CoA thioesterase [Herminiimonas sp. CN]|uniref:tol-pal system-associated acyl-CoA thioesterase n=1 Tax=Herminiimonas sp. CN TaxID=1349818 RepID=UPI000473F3B2|nr:tol-pal system-associated acyl-CoA thioesterase [Herminiimonas sp. CN]